MIQVFDLYKDFGKLRVLNGIDLKIEPGEVVVIIGPSGSGKSTFLRCLNFLEEPTAGEVIFEGVSFKNSKNDVNRLREKMGMVFQQFNLFPHMTVLENITLAPERLRSYQKKKRRILLLLYLRGSAWKIEPILIQISCREGRSKG